jgi:hypothetical protein
LLISFSPWKIPGTENSRRVQRTLQMWSSLHGADWPFHWYQDQGAPLTHSSGLSRQVGSSWTQHQPGISYLPNPDTLTS